MKLSRTGPNEDKITIHSFVLFVCVGGVGQGSAIVTKRDANSSGTLTQAKTKKHNEEEESLSLKFEAIKRKAEQGDEVAQFNLGRLYYLGEGVEKDLKEAMKWFRKAAEWCKARTQAEGEKGRG